MPVEFQKQFQHFLSNSKSLSCLTAAFAAFLLFQTPLHEAQAAYGAVAETASIDELGDLDLEKLMEVKVFSASKQPEHVFSAASGIYVITAKDIHESGATSLPEALRLAPGVQVSMLSVNQWVVSIRGFGGGYTNKLLVLQDGRTLYNPLFSGVYWDEHEIMLEDIEQIEVIRGPGATLWGSNAVNGVINITTKSAKNTLGGLITASGGTTELGSGSIRYGAKIGESGYLRMYGKAFYREGEAIASATNNDGQFCTDRRGGFRGDWNLNSKNSATMQGDIYDSFTGFSKYSGKNLLGRWNHSFSDTSELSLQLYYDRTDGSNSTLHHFERYDTADFDLQQTFMLGRAQKLVWGAGIRRTYDELNSNTSYPFAFNPASKTQFLYSGFLQDNITLLPETLQLILGSRIEHNESTGFEIQPTARLALTLNEHHTIWGAVSRAVRTPSRSETAINSLLSPAAAPYYTEVRMFGNTDIPSEKLIAYEAGYRYQPMKTLSFDMALFYNDYSSLIGVVKGTMQQGLYPINVASTSTAIGKGGELSVDWHPLAWLDAAVVYSYLDLKITSSSTLILNNLDLNRFLMAADTSPRHQVSAHSTVTLPYNVKTTLWLRYVSELQLPSVSEYVTADARVAWKPLANLELSLVGQNLLKAKHSEYGVDIAGNSASQVARTVYGKVAWTF
jgi:iron complex outermembrane receptor protein